MSVSEEQTPTTTHISDNNTNLDMIDPSEIFSSGELSTLRELENLPSQEGLSSFVAPLPGPHRCTSGDSFPTSQESVFTFIKGSFEIPTNLFSSGSADVKSSDAVGKLLFDLNSRDSRKRSGSVGSLGSMAGAFASRDWVSVYKDSHVDVEYTPTALFSSDSSDRIDGNKNANRTQPQRQCKATSGPNWMKESMQEFNSFMTVTSAPSTDSNGETEVVIPPKEEPVSTTKPQRRKRKPRPRKNYEPEEKHYVEPDARDVLLGRGGRSNHHSGNRRYLTEVVNLQPLYKKSDKEEKTILSQSLVEYVQNYGGRFLKLDDSNSRWYVVPNIVARKKASQALREENTPEKRAAKRRRYGK